MKKNDAINPEHYNRLSPEPKDVIRSWDLNFNLGNAVKYIARAGHKGDAVEDLKKAQTYIQFEIDAMQAGKEPKEEREPFSMPELVFAELESGKGVCLTEEELMEHLTMKELFSVKPIVVEVPVDVDIDELIQHITGKKPEPVKKEDKQSEHITPVTECVCGDMKTVRFMGNTVEVPVSVPLPEALFFLLEHYVPVKRGK